MTTEIKRQWVKNLSPQEQNELLRLRNERNNRIARDRARQNRTKTAARKYGISEETLLKMIEDANGICCICTGPLDDSLHIDHCHTSLKVRGVLCRGCNNGLGQFKDDSESLRRAADYLDKHAVSNS